MGLLSPARDAQGFRLNGAPGIYKELRPGRAAQWLPPALGSPNGCTTGSVNAFGNAIGQGIADAASSGSSWGNDDTEMRRLQARYPVNGSAFAQDRAWRSAANSAAAESGPAWAVGFGPGVTEAPGGTPAAPLSNSGMGLTDRVMNRFMRSLDATNAGALAPLQTAYRPGPYAPIVEGVYNFASGVGASGQWRASWNNFPTNVALQDADGNDILARFASTGNREEAAIAAARQQTLPVMAPA